MTATPIRFTAENLSDEELFEMVKKDVCEALCVREFKPDLFKVTRHQMAIPQYDKSTPKRMAAFAEAEKRFPGLYLGGNGINGIGIGDRIKQGHEIAQRIIVEMQFPMGLRNWNLLLAE